MRIISLSLIWLATLAGPARPEDFTGAYAGVNAGYAVSGSDRDRVGGLLAPDADRATEMPPSARQASEALRARNRRDRTAPLPR